MFESTVIFQRTHSGRVEIHEKKKGLTQSERLVLIMVDGVSTYSGVRAKLPVLTDDRFQRAIRTLQQKELISEVFMPLEGQAPEEVDRSVVDRFLQQDPLDPVTIIMMDDDELMDLARAPAPQRPAQVTPPPAPAPEQSQDISGVDAPAPATPAPATPETVSSHQEDDARETEEILREIRAHQPERPQPAPAPVWLPPQPELPPPSGRWFPNESTTWIYWTLTVVGAFVLGYAAARLTL